MKLAEYLVEYTLEVIFKGHRSECARRLGMDFPVFKKLRSRLLCGAHSGLLQDAILELYWREGLSLDDMLKSYTETRMGEDIEAAESMCRDLMESGAEILESRRSEAQDDALLLKAAQSFFDAIVSYVCNHICQKTSYAENECPIAKYLDYMRWLEDELDACRRKS